MTLPPFIINTYEKQGGGGGTPLRSNSSLTFNCRPPEIPTRWEGLLPPRLQLSTDAGQLFPLSTLPMRHLPARPRRPSTFVLCRRGSFLYLEFYCPFPPLPATLSFSQEVSL